MITTKKKTAAQRAATKTIEEIAKKHLDLQTLETRNRDSLDFHTRAVWCLSDALEAAYQAGLAAGTKAKR